MMGYAHGPDDLALGKTVETLRTGDIARRCPDGLYEVVGRNSRFVKMYGLRIDLQQVEAALRARGMPAFCTSDDDILVVAAAGTHDDREVQRAAAEAAGVPAGAVRAVVVDGTAAAAVRQARLRDRAQIGARDRSAPQSTDLRGLFADVLQVDAATLDPDASFVDLGGNSLSYVTMTVRLERAIGQLPPDWQRMSIRQLEGISKPARRSWLATLETSVALRAAAIVLIVGSHAELFELWGGAHILLGVAGYNFGRFCLTPVPRTDRVRHLGNTIAWIAVPSVLWVVIALLLTDHYTWTNLLLANKFLGPHDSMTAGRLWFVEVLVWTLVVLALVFWLPLMDRLERRLPVHRRRRLPRHRAGAALRHPRAAPWPRCVVHHAGVLVLRDRLGGVESDDDAAARRGVRRPDRQPARLFRQHPARSDGHGRSTPAHLGADDSVSVRADSGGRSARRGVAVHLPGPLPGVRAVRRPSRAMASSPRWPWECCSPMW